MYKLQAQLLIYGFIFFAHVLCVCAWLVMHVAEGGCTQC